MLGGAIDRLVAVGWFLRRGALLVHLAGGSVQVGEGRREGQAGGPLVPLSLLAVRFSGQLNIEPQIIGKYFY